MEAPTKHPAPRSIAHAGAVGPVRLLVRCGPRPRYPGSVGRAHAIAVLVLAIGCGRVGYDAQTTRDGGRDASTDAGSMDATTDGGPDASIDAEPFANVLVLAAAPLELSPRLGDHLSRRLAGRATGAEQDGEKKESTHQKYWVEGERRGTIAHRCVRGETGCVH